MSKNQLHSFNNVKPIVAQFVCQNCAQPLRLEKSLQQLDEQTFAGLTGVPFSRSSNDDAIALVPTSSRIGIGSSTDALEITRKYSSTDRSSENGSNGFMLIGETPNKELENYSYNYQVMTRLFDILSDQSDIDHPLCEECADNLLDQMDDQLKMIDEEYNNYSAFLERLQQTQSSDNLEELEQELNHLKVEQTDLERQLQDVEDQKMKALKELEEEKKEEEKLATEEERYRKEYCSYKRQLMLFEDEQHSVDNQLKYAETQLSKLRKTNVFNATFHICSFEIRHCGEFGTINNFRLGRLHSCPVEWHEINAAWGQTVLLLHSLANKIGLTFQRYRLVPYGNHSYLECLEDKSKELPLYGSGGIRFFWDTKFDQAMVAFLDCLQQFKEEVQKGDTGFSLPYKMDKGRIEETGKVSYSIRIQFNSEEQWTKALKFMLTNLKWGLAWVCSQSANR